MRIESVDFFYLAIPEVLDIGDGSQDALLVRVRAGGHTGWGECEASPLVSMASWNCPMSHSACKPVSASVIGQTLDGPEDIRRINRLVRANCLDLLQADHTLSGIDIALWDLLARKEQVRSETAPTVTLKPDADLFRPDQAPPVEEPEGKSTPPPTASPAESLPKAPEKEAKPPAGESATSRLLEAKRRAQKKQK